MPPQVNPLTAPLSALKQIGEQTSAAIQQVGTGMASAASQTLDAFITGIPPLPGLPGAPAVAPGVPALNQLLPNQLLPANLQQALSQVENILIPPGLPRPTQIMRGVVPTPPAPAAPPAEAPPAPPAIAARRRVAERRGM